VWIKLSTGGSMLAAFWRIDTMISSQKVGVVLLG